MRQLPLLLALSLLTALLAGCTGNAAKTETQTSSEITPASVDQEGATFPPKPMRTPIDVTAAVSQPWAKPGESVTLSATSAKATSYSWYLQLRAPSTTPAPAQGGGSSSLGVPTAGGTARCFGPGCPGAAPPPPPKPQPKLDTGNIEAGKTSKSLQLSQEGLYQFHCHPHPSMKMNVTVKQGAPATDQTVTILDGPAQSEYRYSPEDLVVGPGTRVQFRNAGDQMHTATQEAYLEIIPGEGKSVTFTPQTAGDYDVVVIARDATTGVGIAKARLFIDPTKPEEEQTIGPYSGELEKGIPNAPADQQSSATHSFTTAFPFKSLKLSFTTASKLPGDVIPAPASVVISLSPDGGEPLATSEPGATGELAFDALPAGAYVITVTADTGVMIGYTVTGEAILDLQLAGSAPVQDESQPHGH